VTVTAIYSAATATWGLVYGTDHLLAQPQHFVPALNVTSRAPGEDWDPAGRPDRSTPRSRFIPRLTTGELPRSGVGDDRNHLSWRIRGAPRGWLRDDGQGPAES